MHSSQSGRKSSAENEHFAFNNWAKARRCAESEALEHRTTKILGKRQTSNPRHQETNLALAMRQPAPADSMLNLRRSF
eukprot:1448862-Amphidinium_carterae.1